MATCPGCLSPLPKKVFDCKVCAKDHCRSCCKRYLALKGSTEQVRLCNSCFLQNVVWDSRRTYDVFGPADGHTVVLVHGAVVGRQCLVREARALAEAGFRVLLPDLPGHGARFKEQLSLDSAMATLLELISKEVPSGQRIVMAGFSMGGFIAAAFAAAHPELMAGVVLGACGHNAHNTSWRLMGRISDFVYRVCSYKTKSGFITKSGHMDLNREDIQECFLRAGAEYDSWPSCWRVMYDANLLEKVPRIYCPALLVVGAKDFRDAQRPFLQQAKHGRCVVLAGGEHAFTTQPDIIPEFRKQLMAWLADINWCTGEGPAASDKATTPEGPTAATAAAAATVPPAKSYMATLVQSVWCQRGK